MRHAVAMVALSALLAGDVRADDEPEPAAREVEAIRSGVVVALDASAALGGASETPGRSVLDEVLGGVRAAVEEAKPAGEQALAVRVLGGSISGRCETTLVVPAGISPEPLLAPLAKGLTARGGRPLALGLSEAANDLPRGEGRFRSLVLVTGGVDGCGRDVCAEAAELRREVGLGQVQVIAVRASAAARERLTCLGPVRIARNSEEIRTHVADAIAAAFDPATLTVEALAGREVVQADVEVRAGDDDPPVSLAPTGRLTLPAGRYHLRVFRDGDSGPEEGWRRRVSLAPATDVALRIPLVPVTATLLARVRLNGERAPEGTRVRLFRPGDETREVAAGWAGEPIALPPGRYDLRAEVPAGLLGTLTVWRPEVTVRAGEPVQLALDASQPVGRLRVRVRAGDEPADEATVFVLPDGGREETERSIPPDTDALLPVGTVTLLARLDTVAGPVSKWLDSVEIRADATKRVTLELGEPGRLRVQLSGDSAARPTLGVAKPGTTELLGRLEPSTTYVVPPGKWDLLYEEPGPPARRLWRRGVEVPPGELRTVRFSPPAK